MVRIVAGKYRRRRLLTLPGETTRPITDRVKEALFARLQADLEDRRVIDLFAGSGTIGLEALSRGARSVVFVENDRRVHHLLKQNVERLGITSQVLCWRTDVIRCSFRPKGVDDLLPFDLAFCDPPYRLIDSLKAHSRFSKSLDRLARDEVTTDDARLLLRTPARAQFDPPARWNLETTWELRTMHIHVFQKEPS